MTDDKKEWVTIKIPEDVRDDAREDPRTYEAIMRDGLDDGDYPADELTLDVDDLASEIADRVEDTGGVGPEQVAREVSRRLDYAQVANAVADEVEGRLR